MTRHEPVGSQLGRIEKMAFSHVIAAASVVAGTVSYLRVNGFPALRASVASRARRFSIASTILNRQRIGRPNCCC
jgi:hypothetical protein